MSNAVSEKRSSTRQPTASVVIPVKNGGALLLRVLEAVLRQRTSWPFEVLAIDSGSRDGSQDAVRLLGVRVHEISPEEFGHGRTRNLGVELTRGKFIVFLTQDALPANDHWLQELVGGAQATPDIAGAFGPHWPYPEAGPVTARELAEHFAGFGKTLSVVRLEDPERYRVDPGYRQFLHYFSSNNACLRRDIWRKEPFPDVDFAEDQLWAKSVMEAGYAKAYVPTAAVYHSHEFGIAEGARRAFDESRAMKALFGYDLVPGLRHLAQQWLLITRRDWRWIMEADMPRSERAGWILRTPLRVLGRLSGYYVGGHQNKLPQWLIQRFSRDKRLQRA